MKIALVGNPNSGKTTIFNALTGMNAQIGNWPGVTIEKKVGIIKNTRHEIIDLPGIYSLSPYSTEEEISRKYIFEEKPDIIINIVDSTSIERSLYLTSQLLELDTKIIIALNMCDLLEKKGLDINTAKLENMLGAKVIKISALKKNGIENLIKEIENKIFFMPSLIYDNNLENTINEIESALEENVEHKRFVAVKLIEKDLRFENFKNIRVERAIEEINRKYTISLEEIIASQRYDFISYINKNAVTKEKTRETITDKLDKIFLNKWLAIPIFGIIMFIIYFISINVVGNLGAEAINNIIEICKKGVTNKLIQFNVSNCIISLIVDGIITGVGSAISFIPTLTVLFLCMSILENTGYMSRIALLLDSTFKKIGLSGKSLIPFIMGSGCSVTGIMGTRIIENEKQRKMTIVFTPFIPCSAKLPIIALFSGYFFKENSAIVSFSLYFLSIVVIIISAFLTKKFILKENEDTYIAELPDYKIPNLTYIFKEVMNKVIEFLKRAGSLILICSVIIWFLLSFSFDLKYGVSIEKSILACIGKAISWILYPVLGVKSWEATVSSLQGLIAKEQVISSMQVISGMSKAGEDIFKANGNFNFFSPISAYTYMVFNLFSAPCIGAISAMKQELGKTKLVIKAVCFQIIFAWVLATIIFQVGNNVDSKFVKIIFIWCIATIVMLVLRKILYSIKNSNKKARGCVSCPYCLTCKKG